MATPAKIAKREHKLPLERALRALEDVHQSLKDFSTTDTVTNNDAFAAELKTVRHKAKKLRKRANTLAGLWDRTFESNDWRHLDVQKRAGMALIRVRPTQADVAIADGIAARTGRPTEHVAEAITWGATNTCFAPSLSAGGFTNERAMRPYVAPVITFYSRRLLPRPCRKRSRRYSINSARTV